jgi:hypothetical protein
MEYLIRLMFIMIMLGSNNKESAPPLAVDTIQADTQSMSLDDLEEWLDQEEIELAARREELDALRYEIEIVETAYADKTPPRSIIDSYKEKLDRLDLLITEFNERVRIRNAAVEEYNQRLNEGERE